MSAHLIQSDGFDDDIIIHCLCSIVCQCLPVAVNGVVVMMSYDITLEFTLEVDFMTSYVIVTQGFMVLWDGM